MVHIAANLQAVLQRIERACGLLGLQSSTFYKERTDDPALAHSVSGFASSVTSTQV